MPNLNFSFIADILQYIYLTIVPCMNSELFSQNFSIFTFKFLIKDSHFQSHRFISQNHFAVEQPIERLKRIKFICLQHKINSKREKNNFFGGGLGLALLFNFLDMRLFYSLLNKSWKISMKNFFSKDLFTQQKGKKRRRKKISKSNSTSG